MRKLVLLFFCVLTTLASHAQKEVYISATPAFTVTVPEGDGDGRAVVIVPGGGYNHIAGAHEGKDWIPFFTQQGIAVIVTNYTLPEGDRETPLADIRNTFRFLHEHGEQWGINPNAIGIMGFSAGGHLASAYANSEKGVLRPAFEILFYPVIRLDNKEHVGMARRFLGENASEELRSSWSTHRMVTSETPMTFIVTADDDPTIDPLNSALYYEALRKKRVQCSMHIYPSGGHGFGFRTSFPYHEQMKTELSDWLKTIFVPNAKARKIACIGNSITYGARLKFRDRESWPAQLQVMLGQDYWVRNFGNSGTTMTDGERSYVKEAPYEYVKQFTPDVVFIKLGTNDVQPRHWKNEDAYMSAYQKLIDELKTLPSKPQIVLCLPVTSYRKEKILDSDIQQKVIPLIRKIAKKNKLDVIDLHSPTANHPELFPDQLHPNADGERIIAESIATYINEKCRH